MRWKAALLQVADITGFRRLNYANDAKLMEKVVAAVLDNLPTPPLVPPARHPAGLEEPSAQVINMMHKMGDNVRVLGICGTGGIGKTTLAREVYNGEQSNFEHRCFLNDVREAKGVAVMDLQMKMVADLLNEDVRKRLWDSTRWLERIQNLKVLIVIDDVNKKLFDDLIPDLEQLAPGSRVLITSRDQGILKDIPQSEFYEVPELSYSNSSDLFIWCTFWRNNLDSVEGSFHNFVKEITLACCGLRLALEDMRGFLAHKKNLPDDEKYWDEAISALRMNQQIITMLQISHDGLADNDCKRMFLDIACFMLGHPCEAELVIGSID